MGIQFLNMVPKQSRLAGTTKLGSRSDVRMRSAGSEVEEEGLAGIPPNKLDSLLRESAVHLVLDSRLSETFREVRPFNNAKCLHPASGRPDRDSR